MALRRIFGRKIDEVTGGWGKLYIEEVHNLFSSVNNIRMMMSKRKGWEEHVARMRSRTHVCY
jgi:hypothetical protein